jgi:hypothetical protein
MDALFRFYSIAIASARKQFGVARLENAVAKDFPHPCSEIRDLNFSFALNRFYRAFGGDRCELSHDATVFSDFDRLAAPQNPLDGGEVVP